MLRPMPPTYTTLDHSIGTSLVDARLRSSTAVPFAEPSFHGNIGTSLITALGLSVLVAHSPLLGVAVASFMAADFSDDVCSMPLTDSSFLGVIGASFCAA